MQGLVAAALAALLVAPIAAPPAPAKAAGGRVITIGESADARQRLELLRSFDASGPDDVAIVTLADASPLDDLFGGAEGVWSSTVLVCDAPGAGLSIDTGSAVGLPPALFALPLAAAGATDATLRVAVPDGAPAEPVSALAGVLKTWGVAPCAAPDADGTGREIALDAIALAADIGAAISPDDPAAGLEPAALLILNAQGAALASPDRLATVVAAGERDAGFVLPHAERKRLGEFLRRSIAHDWGALAGGWAIDTADPGDGFALRFVPVDETRNDADPAAMAAPALDAIAAGEGVAERSGTGLVKIAAAALVGAAEADEEDDEEERIRAMSASVTPAALPAQPGPVIRFAQPPATNAATTAPAPAAKADADVAASPVAVAEDADATPAAGIPASPATIDGTLIGAGGGRVAIAQPGQPRAEHRLADDAPVARDGAESALAALMVGDRVRLTVDPATGLVIALDASPASRPLPTLPLVALALIPPILAALVLNRRRAPEPFVVVYRPAVSG